MIDFRSDTLTLPSKRMLDAISKAQVGDDGRVGTDGRGEDVTVNKLENEGSDLFGKESAVFVPSGTMGNLVALMSSADYGESVGVNHNLHLYRSEKGIFATRPGGLKAEFYESDEYGKPAIESIKKLFSNKSIKVLTIENSLNFAGGACLTKADMKEICDICHDNQITVHLDGARIFNAAAFLGCNVKDLCSDVDSVMFCLSKGLGAPVGSLLVGSQDLIRKARVNRKLVGGGMRQAGILAAAGLIALYDGPQQVITDNLNAKKIADSLIVENGALSIDPAMVQTNIIRVNVQKTGLSAEQVCRDLLARGIRVNPLTETSFRLVTYREIDDFQVNNAIEILTAYSRSFSKGF